MWINVKIRLTIGKLAIIMRIDTDFSSILLKGGVIYYENDISAEEKIKSQSSWIPQENENIQWQKGDRQKKGERKKKIICIRFVSLLSCYRAHNAHDRERIKHCLKS